MLKGLNFIKNVGVSYISVLITSFIGLYSIPLAISHFNTEIYAIWLLVSSIIAYLSMSNFGIPTASGAMIAKSSDRYFQKQIVVKSFIALIIVSSIVFLILFFFSKFFPEWIVLLGDFSAENVITAKNVFVIMIIGFLLCAPLQIVLTAFTALQKIYISKIYQLNIILLNLIMLLIVVNNMYDLVVLAGLTVAGNFVIYFIALLHLYFSEDISEKTGKEINLRKVFSKGLPFFYIGIASTIVWATDNIVISHVIGLEEIVIYSIAFKLFTTGFIVFTVLSAVMFPLYGKFYSLNQWENVQKVYDLNLIVLPFIASVLWLGGILFGKEVVLLWTEKEELFGGHFLFFALGGYGFILSIVNTHANLLSGLNIVSNTVKVSWLEATLNVSISVILGLKFGIAGVALGTMLASFLGPFIFLPYYINLNTKRKVYSDLVSYIKVFSIVTFTILIISFLMIIFNINMVLKVLIFTAYIISYCFIKRKSLLSIYKLIK